MFSAQKATAVDPLGSLLMIIPYPGEHKIRPYGNWNLFFDGIDRVKADGTCPI